MKSLMMIYTQTGRIGDPILGIIIPGFILLVSMILTWALYKRFSKKSDDKK